MTPKVSIILPTYNRADTICRAIKSVLSQTFEDWELIVVDDGSTDDTAVLLAPIEDSRMILIRQENRGFTEARNAGIRASTGNYIAFLDSDDEFLPHHLELCVAFLESFPEEHFVSTELLENLGEGRLVQHYRIETSQWYPENAKRIGSHMLDLPPGETDNYLRVYECREPIGEWGSEIVARTGNSEQSFLYHGMIFEYLRWGFLITITATVIRRSALDTVGLPDPGRSTGSDFHFMACLCRNFRTNFLSVPTFVKHELSPGDDAHMLDHVVTGKTALKFARDWEEAWEDLFWNSRQGDPELAALRSLRLVALARVALRFEQRELVLHSLREARKGHPRFWRAIALEWLVKGLPSAPLSRKAWVGLGKAAYAAKQVLHRELSLKVFLGKAMARIN